MMNCIRKFTVVIFILIISLSPTYSKAVIPDIIISISDTLVQNGQDQGQLSVFISSNTYEVFGGQFALVSSRPDLVLFKFSEELDTIGTLVGGFDLANGFDTEGDQSVLLFNFIADLVMDSENKYGILPGQSGLLVKIPYTTTNLPDTTIDMTSLITIISPANFSDRNGYSIGMITEVTIDTSYYICDAIVNTDCVSWHETDTPESGYDFLNIDTLQPGTLDPSVVKFNSGSITLYMTNCDFDATGEVDISDIVCFVNYIFRSETVELCPLLRCDADGNSETDISDLVFLVNFMFKDGPPPPTQ